MWPLFTTYEKKEEEERERKDREERKGWGGGEWGTEEEEGTLATTTWPIDQTDKLFLLSSGKKNLMYQE